MELSLKLGAGRRHSINKMNGTVCWWRPQPEKSRAGCGDEDAARPLQHAAAGWGEIASGCGRRGRGGGRAGEGRPRPRCYRGPSWGLHCRLGRAPHSPCGTPVPGGTPCQRPPHCAGGEPGGRGRVGAPRRESPRPRGPPVQSAAAGGAGPADAIAAAAAGRPSPDRRGVLTALRSPTAAQALAPAPAWSLAAARAAGQGGAVPGMRRRWRRRAGTMLWG